MMGVKDDEEERFRPTTIVNSRAILLSRQRAEEELPRQSEWMRVTLASLGDAVLSTDSRGIVTFMNGVAESLTGWREAEAQGHPLPEVFHIVDEHTREPFENTAIRPIREGIVVRLSNHTILVGRDGTERPIDASAAPIRDDSGARIGTVLVFRDIADRKRAEEAQSRLAAIVESSEDAIISKTLDAVITSWNKAAERLFGYSAAEAVGQSITMIIPPERLDEERAILDRLRRGERVEHFETVRLAKDGRQVEISLTVSPMRDNDDRIIGASKVARDITNRKRDEEILREQSRLLREVAAAGLSIHSAGSLESVLIAIAEQARRILNAQRVVSSLTVTEDFAQEPSAVSTSQEFERWREDTMPPAVEEACAQVCRTNQSLRLTQTELEAHAASRNTAVQRSDYPPLKGWLGTPLVGRDGKNLGLIRVLNKESGEFTESDEAALTQLAHIGAVAIENARLYGELREQDRRKDEFLALLAHELRNPLAPLRNGLQVMRLAARDACAVDQARAMMDRQLGHMVRLVDDLLDISRVSRNKLELRRARVLLADVLNSAVETTRPLIDEERHELTVSLPRDNIHLDADLTRLAQVFGNLLSNSAKYTSRGGRIWLTAERQREIVLVSVRDNGIGIPAEFLGTIFDMFAQVDRSLERSTGGLGIGLALVKGLVKMHGGTVTAESPGPGKGSTFTVRLPVCEDLRDPPLERTAEQEPRASAPKRRILVVDDNRDSAMSLAIVLRLMGNDARTAYDGVEAVETAEAFRPQVILMDMGMPRLNGYEATRRIREQPWGSSVTIIALTGWGQEGDKARSLNAGCDGHLVKPVEAETLDKLLAQLKTESA